TVRDKATQDLRRVGELAEPELKLALAAKPPLEMERRIQQLLATINKDRLAPDILRAIRAVEVLEHIASTDACELLAGLARGAPGARLTCEARASWQRLTKRAAPSP